MTRSPPRPCRAGVSLLEVMMAVVVLALLGGPLIANLVTAKRSVGSSTRDVEAVLRASAVMELLKALPYEDLPALDPAVVTDELEGPGQGVAHPAWEVAFAAAAPPAQAAMAALPADREGRMTYLWIEAGTRAGEDGASELTYKEVTVTVTYPGMAKDDSSLRRYALRSVRVAGR